MQAEELLQRIKKSMYGGGSGRGLSFLCDAAECGKRALFTEAKLKMYADDESTLPSDPLTDPTYKKAYAIGSTYHLLHEMWRRDLLGDGTVLDYNEPFEDPNVNEGVRLFRGWREHFDREFWGRQVAVELTLPISKEAQAAMVHAYGVEVNAKPDLVVEVAESDLSRVQQRCPNITEPGYYIVDFKTSDTAYQEVYYTSGHQAQWYPVAWEMDYPDKPIKGVIFDIILKFSRRRDRTITPENFKAHVALISPLGPPSIKGLVDQAYANIDRAKQHNLGNPAACSKFAFGGVDLCPYYGSECLGE